VQRQLETAEPAMAMETVAREQHTLFRGRPFIMAVAVAVVCMAPTHRAPAASEEEAQVQIRAVPLATGHQTPAAAAVAAV
jgi:hypothetical protein